RLWKQLCVAVGRGDLPDDPRFLTNTDRVKNRAAMKAELEGAFAAFTVAELAERLEEAAVPCGRVRNLAEALQDAQVDARQMFFEFADPELAGFKVPGNPIKLSGSSARLTMRPPRHGEHTQAVLEEIGLTPTGTGE